jgi:Flp pilus assembly protein TadG
MRVDLMIASLNATFLRTTSAWKAFRRETDGNATIEAVLWLPLFVVFLVMIADVSFVFHRQSQIMNIVQDGNRALSVGRIANEEDLVTFVEGRLAGLTTAATVTTSIDTGVVTTNVLVPVDDLVAVGTFAFLSNYNIGVSSQQFIEY